MSTQHPHLEGLIRTIIAEWRDAANQHVHDLARCTTSDTVETLRDCANDLEAALAALPGGGVDEAMVDRMIARYLELEPGEAENVTKSHPATRAFCRELLTAALPTPNPHEADRNA